MKLGIKLCMYFYRIFLSSFILMTRLICIIRDRLRPASKTIFNVHVLFLLRVVLIVICTCVYCFDHFQQRLEIPFQEMAI